MASVTAVQAVAKRLERMLETALNQLKVEQRLRREGDIKLIDLELSLVNSEHALKSSEERFDASMAEKEDMIAALEAKVKRLEAVKGQKEQGVLEKEGQEPFSELQENAERFEDRLKDLLDSSEEVSVEDELDIDETVLDDDEEVEIEIDEGDEEVKPSEETESSNSPMNLPTVETKRNQMRPKDETLEEIDPKQISRCTVCVDEFPNNKELTEHQRETGHGYDLICTICEKKFKDKYVLKSHVARIHSDDMPFKCTKCEHRFKDEGSCRRHQANNTLHIRLEKEKLSPRLMCNICGKEFPRKRRWCLDQHYLTHMDPRHYPCTACGKDFSREAYLIKHMSKCEHV